MADNFDKFLPDWQIGTLTLTANSTAFTATDALLTFGSIQQGDFIISPDGRMLIIESITDDSNGVLSSPCPPEAAGTFPTRIRYQSDNSRYTGQTAALRRLMSDGNLFSLAKLTGDPEMIVRFLGNGAFDLVDPAEFGLQDPTGSLGKLAAITLAANKILNTDASGNLTQSDITAAALSLLNLSGTPVADRLPYLNGASGAALTPLTAVARNLLDDTNTAGQRLTLGVGRPAFKATTSAAVPIGNGTNTIPFNQVAMNVGNGWSGQTFTAPESGVYAFSVDFVISGGTDNAGNTILSLYRDGFWYQETVRSRRTDYFHSIDISTFVYLNAGQTFYPRVTLEFWAGTVTAGGGRCTISGALIG